VTLGRPVDGDTAHFDFSDSGDETIRFLFVNTEESHGEATTRFGVETAAVVARYLRSAREIVVAVREDRNRPGRPNYDPYGRWLGLVFLDGELLETRLVREGLSAYYTEFGCAPEPVHTALVHAEAEAHAAGAGIWAPGHPTDYRPVLQDWIGRRACRPNPFEGPYCP
jgi:endonuclease YncB( thermonuclease family)